MSENVIELEQAQEWANSWRSLEDKSPFVDNLKGWWVPGSDLSQVMAEGAVDSRMYLGLDGEDLKLMIVAVDGEGKDMIDAGQGWFIYDFSQNIPPKIDTTSPLN
jgi:hypothetical protein